ncbi:MAG: ABC transporter substrate-binding protein/permease [Bacteroidetes bacterium]|nr:ABC transporter substrate-binding protein/permease [Rhodothermia bacterium]MCX7907734.1 ABC transporter substrate-binding protein/permease [Bacteroidota bacterium]
MLAAALLVGALRATAVCAQPVLRWGADPSGGAPHVFVDPQNPDRYVGFEKEFVEALAAVLGRRPVMVPTDWETIVSALERGEFDIIVNGLEPTTDRAKHILFSKPYYLFRQQLVVRRQENRIRTLADCRDKLVGTLVNTTSSRLLAREGIRYKAYADPPVAYRDLELGRVDAVLMDLPIAQYYAFPNPNLKPAGEPFYVSAYVVGLRKDDRELKAQIDAAIDTLLRNGTMERILRKWNLWDELQAQLAQGEARYDMAASEFNWGEALWRLLRAAAVTVALAFGAMGVALLLGIPLALGQERGPPGVRALCTGYIEFFRGTPVLVQLLFLYFGLPKLGIVLPGWLTALVGLGLNYAAYESQVYRAAFAAVPRGQWEVAYALGMGRALAFRRVILPQAFRVALPPMTNDFVALFKDTSVAFAISVWELATAYRELANASQQFLLLGAITSGLYLAMSLPLARLARRLEARLQRERAREIPHGEEVRA